MTAMRSIFRLCSRPLQRFAVLCVILCLGLVPWAHAEDEEPTLEEAQAFLEQAEADLLEAWMAAERAAWVQANFITYDTNLLAAKASEKVIALNVRLAGEATRFDGLDLPEKLRRKLQKIKLTLNLPAPADGELTAELASIAAQMRSLYGSGKYTNAESQTMDLEELSRILDEGRDAEELLAAWQGWRTISRPIRDLFARYVELGNSGAQELGFADLGALWRSKYDMDPDAFAVELDRLWSQVGPLYRALHCHVRARLVEHYGADVVDPQGAIPAHVLGNMWAQTWSNVYDLVAPAQSDVGYDLTELLEEKGVDEREMVRFGEQFFTSLGFDPLPETFWERSLFEQPKDRDVVCHPSAWDLDWQDDLRIKMCIEINSEDFSTIHHELGHNFYQRAYKHQSPLDMDSANDGFHEAVGDTVALSATLFQNGLTYGERLSDKPLICIDLVA